ncbi:MAG: GNAT family N-acetyltransferase [Proteobacteria bacterium]|nr:MAG: GNAT family N-acetyltransferase [Pseudomonadota bacterium]
MIVIEKYNFDKKSNWDSFISSAKNGHFMFCRDYMDYHSDKFEDSSSMFYDKNKLVAVLVASGRDDVVYCHQGLTFGGLIMSKAIRTEQVLECFELLYNFYKEKGYNKIVYKAIPHIYHHYPAEEDLFAITRYKCNLIRRDISSAVCLHDRIPYTESRKSSIRKFQRSNVVISETNDISEFMGILADVVIKHGVTPVHTVEEVNLLMSRFPDNIKLVAAYLDNQLVAGTLLFINKPVIHTQYMASSALGQEIGALDGIIDYLIKTYSQNTGFSYLNFGISTYNNGKDLNNGLIFQKEGFGARAIVHDFYEVRL